MAIREPETLFPPDDCTWCTRVTNSEGVELMLPYSKWQPSLGMPACKSEDEAKETKRVVRQSLTRDDFL